MEQMGGTGVPVNEQMQMSAEDIVGLRNKLQVELAGRHQEDIFVFIDKHANDVDLMLKADSGLLEEYLRDPSGALQKAEKIIYH